MHPHCIIIHYPTSGSVICHIDIIVTLFVSPLGNDEPCVFDYFSKRKSRDKKKDKR